MLMTASDIAASSKPWHVQKRVARLVTAEFIVQGDKERQQLHIQPQALMDRERQHELPQLQIRWIADICLPLYKVWVQTRYNCNLMKAIYIYTHTHTKNNTFVLTLVLVE
jgi:dual 3',5'-cyclic-AMP and -GMP phosphodiesterase 11